MLRSNVHQYYADRSSWPPDQGPGTEPPELTAPLTTRRALSFWVVSFVHPVGAAVCWNSMRVPEPVEMYKQDDRAE